MKRIFNSRRHALVAIVLTIVTVISTMVTAPFTEATGVADHQSGLEHAVARQLPLRSSMWAVVRSDGSIVRSSGISGALRLGQGVYEVRFTQDVRDCAYTVSVGDPGNQLVYTPGLAFTAGGHISAEGVYVETKNLGGGLSDFPFHLEVSCAGQEYAVVGPFSRGWKLFRGSAQSVSRLGPGHFVVYFNRSMGDCAYTATIADPAAGLVYSPGLAYTWTDFGGDFRGIHVQTRNLAGQPADLPFHLAAHCPQQVPDDSWHAVVNRDGTLVRSDQNFTSVIRYGPGRYDVRSIRDLSNCAYMVTVGDPAFQPVPESGLAFTASGHINYDAVYVETKNLGGGLTDLPFHLQVNCGKRPISEETISILNLNIEGRDETYGPWRARHSRVASWLGANQIVPDIIALQEMPAKKCWVFGGCDPYDYEAVFDMMAGIESAVGVSYRVAIFSAPHTGEPRLDQGRAVLYNPARIRNSTPLAGPIGSWEELTRTITPRYSHPCADLPDRLRWRCTSVDGIAPTAGFAAPHWAALGIAFGRFALAEVPADAPNPPFFDLYDEHSPFIPNSHGTPDLILAADAVSRIEQAIPPVPGARRLVPPLLVGDFNLDANGMRDWEFQPGARLDKFEIVAYSPPYLDGDDTTPDGDVIGVIAGKPELFASRFRVQAVVNRILPELQPWACGDWAVRWSDHCGQYVELALN